MQDELDSVELLARFQRGDENAASLLFERYVKRLTSLARSRLSARLARRVDADDLVQAAYQSFFLGAREGQYSLAESGDLWRLLVAITLNKLRREVEFHTAEKRSFVLEQSCSPRAGFPNLAPEEIAGDPSPEEALGVVEEVAELMRDLNPLQRRMLELRLAGHTVDEISGQVGRSERAVRRLLDKVKDRLSERLAAGRAG